MEAKHKTLDIRLLDLGTQELSHSGTKELKIKQHDRIISSKKGKN
ncbi:hypothetical protein FHS86_003418 [Roseimarinus sediminis]